MEPSRPPPRFAPPGTSPNVIVLGLWRVSCVSLCGCCACRSLLEYLRFARSWSTVRVACSCVLLAGASLHDHFCCTARTGVAQISAIPAATATALSAQLCHAIRVLLLPGRRLCASSGCARSSRLRQFQEFQKKTERERPVSSLRVFFPSEFPRPIQASSSPPMCVVNCLGHVCVTPRQ